MPPKNIDDLLALEAIRQVKARYCRFVDTKQWDRLKTLFTPDARLEGFASAPDGTGPDAFVDAIAKRLDLAITIHHVHTPEITITGPDAARGIWPMMDYVAFAGEALSAEPPADRGWTGWGYYEEDYIRTGGTWLISLMRLVRQRIDPLPADHPEPTYGRHAPDPNWL